MEVTTLDRHHHPNQSFEFSPETGRPGEGGGIYLDVALKKENNTGSIVNVVAATDGQGVTPV